MALKPNVVMIVPTGIGCSIGGHAGDATPAAKLLASVSDTLVLHPNVVNASDINEMPANAIYVEGSTLDRMLAGKIRLERAPFGNHVLVVVNKAEPVIINGVNAACSTIGMTAEILELVTPLRMVAEFKENGAASGTVSGVPELLHQIKAVRHDALAVVTPIEVSKEVAESYCRNGGVNPWGGVEAVASAMIAREHQVPVAHAPFVPASDSLASFNEEVDPRMAAEMVSSAYLFCVMKGLHRAPRPHEGPRGFGVEDVDVLVSPRSCWGPPHRACNRYGIPILVVVENDCLVKAEKEGPCTFVANYLEAAGVLAAMGAGVVPNTVRAD